MFLVFLKIKIQYPYNVQNNKTFQIKFNETKTTNGIFSKNNFDT